jgi:hypothetical protein
MDRHRIKISSRFDCKAARRKFGNKTNSFIKDVVALTSVKLGYADLSFRQRKQASSALR